jgi:hypothetical protein
VLNVSSYLGMRVPRLLLVPEIDRVRNNHEILKIVNTSIYCNIPVVRMAAMIETAGLAPYVTHGSRFATLVCQDGCGIDIRKCGE